DLVALAADAAERAWALCAGDGDGGLTLDPEHDVLRRATAMLAPGRRHGLEDLAGRCGYQADELARLARAWRLGGSDAVEVTRDAWFPPPGALVAGRSVLARLGNPRASRNRLTVGSAGVQLRLSRIGAWYRFEHAGGGWELLDGPETDPSRLFTPYPPYPG
ncbi:MAG: hypothetical protein M3N98_11635, partial [Actinomycetota bacterium]|nr:hypothetical protein [Actinomycetota bacterium]